MLSLKDFSKFGRERKLIVTTPDETIGLEIRYRHENQIVWPGIRQGKIEAYRVIPAKRGVLPGYSYFVRDSESGCTSWVHQVSYRGLVTKNVEVA